ncbi:MAG: glutamate--cysteine ligase [Pelagibacterales bacterium]|nr:glutamate--cysteine ligase [Pelagibacterales bacterium]OUU63348.1 MAG: glutamate--cysteine ligase [Alphaproteobacteria bacterium TMED62]|tara:strand:+ start:6349 stop:7710 length:1362 start_codon:yes stop_codon:yes gene_type:complete
MNLNTLINSKEQLVDWFKLGNKTKKYWRVGTEHEKFAYNYSEQNNIFTPVNYDSKNGIREFLMEISNFGWEHISEEGKVIGLKKDKQSITLEPGGQIELSGAPLKDIHAVCKETNEHLKLVKEIGEKLNITLLGLGLRPQENNEKVPWMPKSRYKIMKNYMPKKGSNGLDMMLSTCTVQANLDYSDEQDMKLKTLLSVKIQPIITALFANSPLSLGKPNGFLSKRRYIWMNTDPDRCGVLKVAFDDDFGFSKYVDYALSVPMYFVKRDNKYIDCSGSSFKDFMSGKLKELPNIIPTLSDWEDHLSTIFTEVRLKQFIEVRGADAGNWRRTCALPAFWVGVLYEDEVLHKALDICKNWNYEEVKKLSFDVAKDGLNAKIHRNTVNEIALELINLAKEGLKKRNIKDCNGKNEAYFLKVLEDITIKEKTPAEQILENLEHDWKGDITELIKKMSY